MNYNATATVLVSVDCIEERDAVIRHLASPEKILKNNITYYVDYKGSYRTVLQTTQKGSINAVTNAINDWNPLYILRVGPIEGFKNQIRSLGDIIVAEKIIDMNGKSTELGTIKEYQYIIPSPMLINISKKMSDQWMKTITIHRPDGSLVFPNVHFESIAGELCKSQRLMDIHTSSNITSNIAGIETDVYGIGKAAIKAEIGMAVIEGISYWTNQNKKNIWHNIAVENTAAYTIALIEQTFNDRLFIPGSIGLEVKEKAFYAASHLTIPIDKRQVSGKEQIESCPLRYT